jgi:hypothetical protein
MVESVEKAKALGITSLENLGYLAVFDTLDWLFGILDVSPDKSEVTVTN